MRYPHTVTFEEPSEDREPSGQVIHTFAAVADLTDLQARIVPEQEEDRTNDMIVETDRFTIIVQGDRAIERTHRVTSDYLDSILGVVRVQRPVLYRSNLTNATIVTAEKIAADVAEVSV